MLLGPMQSSNMTPVKPTTTIKEQDMATATEEKTSGGKSQVWKHEDFVAWATEQGLITAKSTPVEVVTAFAANRGKWRKTPRYRSMVTGRKETAAAEREARKTENAAKREAAKAETAAKREAAKAEKAAAAAKAPAKATKAAAKKEAAAPAKAAAKKTTAKKSAASAPADDNPFG